MTGIKQRFNQFPFNPAKSPVFYGWIIVFWGTIGVIMSAPGQTTGISTFTDHLIDAFELSRNQLSTAYLIGTIASSFFITGAGRLYDRIGSRWMGILTTWTMGLVLLYLSQSDRIAAGLSNVLNLQKIQLFISFAVLVLGFFMLRLSGQGALTMLSRNMIMKWFIAKRGIAGGISSVFVSLGFSIAPLLFDGLIESTSWRSAWMIVALVAGFGFSFFIFLFYRDNPEDCDILPDGNSESGKPKEKIIVKAIHQFTLKEARKTHTYWIFTLSMAIHAMVITGFIFNVVSIFDEAGMDKNTALSVFIPASFVSVVVTLVGGYFSDFIRLKKLLIIMMLGQTLSVISLPFLSVPFFYYLLIIGNGIVSGMYAVLISVSWPRFFGRQHLGEISGSALSVIVFFSAIGPLMFSLSLSYFGSYTLAAWICFILCLVVLLGAFRANNPQEKIIKASE